MERTAGGHIRGWLLAMLVAAFTLVPMGAVLAGGTHPPGSSTTSTSAPTTSHPPGSTTSSLPATTTSMPETTTLPPDTTTPSMPEGTTTSAPATTTTTTTPETTSTVPPTTTSSTSLTTTTSPVETTTSLPATTTSTSMATTTTAGGGNGERLPDTGSAELWLAAVGLLLLALGGLAIEGARRRRHYLFTEAIPHLWGSGHTVHRRRAHTGTDNQADAGD